MKKITMKKILLFTVLSVFLISCNGNAQKNADKESSENYEVSKTKEEWKEELTSEEFAVLRNAATETPFSSDLLDIQEPGTFICAACGQELYETEHKFESGTGWPSFTQPIEENAVAYHKDVSFGMIRVEALCNSCDSHLGHVFEDGPPPSGLRYCINAVALEKI